MSQTVPTFQAFQPVRVANADHPAFGQVGTVRTEESTAPDTTPGAERGATVDQVGIALDLSLPGELTLINVADLSAL